MKLPPKIRSYAFWVGLSSALVILAQSIGRVFGMEIEGSIIENVVMAICGVLVVLGIVSKPAEDQDDVPQDDGQCDPNQDNDQEQQ